jgi:transcriptional regulator with XRE-family HTH domain
MSRQKPIFNFGQNLRWLMDERRIRLSHLAHEIEVPKSTIHSWMYGGQPRDLVALKKVADYFSISVDEICFGDTTQKPQELQAESLSQQTKDGLNIGSFDVILLRRQK